MRRQWCHDDGGEKWKQWRDIKHEESMTWWMDGLGGYVREWGSHP